MTESNPITRALVAALAHSTEPMVLTDARAPDNPMMAVNAAFADLTAFPPEETLGRNCRFLQGPGTDPACAARIRAAVEQGRGCVEWIVNHRRDGTRFWNLLFISPVFDEDGVLLHFFGNQRDITAGVPADLSDYTIGRADMPAEVQADFHALIRGILAEPTVDAGDAPGHARALERITAAAERLNRMTTSLAPAAWQPPAPSRSY